MRVAVVDIGSAANIGWAIDAPEASGTTLNELVRVVAHALGRGPVALGFEAPQFVPMRDDPLKLTHARFGEAGSGQRPRPFSAAAGSSALVTSLVVVPYVLNELRKDVPGGRITFDWTRPPSAPGELLLFEAFVSGQSDQGPDRHMNDARRAVFDFKGAMKSSSSRSSHSRFADPNIFNLLAAAVLRTGWSDDIKLLSAPCLVVRSADQTRSPQGRAE